MVAVYDYNRNRFRGYLSSKTAGSGCAGFLRWVRSKYPRSGRIYPIQKNLSTHATREAVAEARRQLNTFVPAPTNIIHLNPIETHFRTVRRLAFMRPNYTDWNETIHALRQAMRRLNRIQCASNSRPALRGWRRHQPRG